MSGMVLLLKTIQNHMIKELSRWKCENQYKFDENEHSSITFNKAIIKLMNLTFSQDSTMSKIKNGLYMYLRTDLKKKIEYDFEF